MYQGPQQAIDKRVQGHLMLSSYAGPWSFGVLGVQ
jgi:hypothetical protein